MDRGRCREILEGYGIVLNMICLIMYFWDNALLVCRASWRYGTEFRANHGVTQGRPLSPKLFNIMVDAIVREWLRQVLGVKEVELGIGMAIRYLVVLFYVNDGYIVSTDPSILQDSLDILIVFFKRV